MAESEVSKLRVLAVMQMLHQEASKEHPLQMCEIAAGLEKRGIYSKRRAIGRDIAALRRVGYNIVFTRTPYPGYYLSQRILETAEVRMLLDAVSAAPFLTEEATIRLTEKLKRMLPSGEQEALQKQIYYDPARKLENNEVVHTVSVIQQAIARKQKISFTYHHRTLCAGQMQQDGGRLFLLSPYALFWRDDHYYLAGNYEKYDTVSKYRLDRMYDVCMEPEPVRPFTEVTPYTGRFDTADYLRHAFFLFGGREEQLLLRCDCSLMDVLADRFGEEMEILEWDREVFTAHVCARVSEGLYGWLLQYGARLAVMAPTYVRDEMRRRLWELEAVYRLPEDEKQPPETGGCLPNLREPHMLDKYFHADGD
ncbi:MULTISPECIES: helix-turn-helix transcriptional regulator [Caproicibacterium]|uniref:WYL domain-containing protein n=1 Tax=Caproicibacterium argilliputei TaxID=3030016 RepID=A0AA97H2X0_9FIRM|nr:WYL domain-containing protein [Caproicibacterium argilliputei]WOC33180.1 WYL domain-containing protein [Caproicibacterium argilliputei]